jgi:hypothetical protein
MKKNIVVCLFVLTVSVFGQTVDKAQYKAIDPFDYKLNEDDSRVRRGMERKFKSVVEFVLEGKEKGTTFYRFSSLDKGTLLELEPRPGMKPPSRGQTVTVYFTANKRPSGDNRILDAFEDNKNRDEKEIGVEKSPILPSTPNLRKSDYNTITSDDYRDDALFTQEGDDDRKFKATLQFVSKDGIIFKFSSPENPLEQPAFLSMKVKRRYSPFTAGQKMVVYFTASKDYKDFLILDDIELVK